MNKECGTEVGKCCVRWIAQSFFRFHAALSNRRVHISLPFSYPQMAIDGQFGYDRAREARIDPEPFSLTHVEEVCSSQSRYAM